MKIKESKKYKYFVSFNCSGGYGHTDVERNDQIIDGGDLDYIEKDIAEKGNVTKVVILYWREF